MKTLTRKQADSAREVFEDYTDWNEKQIQKGLQKVDELIWNSPNYNPYQAYNFAHVVASTS